MDKVPEKLTLALQVLQPVSIGMPKIFDRFLHVST